MLYLCFVLFILLFFAFIYSVFKSWPYLSCPRNDKLSQQQNQIFQEFGSQNQPNYFILRKIHKPTNLTLISLSNVIPTAYLSEMFRSQFCLPSSCTTPWMRLSRRFMWCGKLRKNLVGMRATWKSAHRTKSVKHICIILGVYFNINYVQTVLTGKI